MNDERLDPQIPHQEFLSKTEEEVRNIWSSVFQRDDIPLDKSFVEIGGDSILAILCISRLRAVLGVECTIEMFLMERSSIRDFVALVG